MRDPSWELANLVYIPYCSSDAHMGDSDHEASYKIVIFKGMVSINFKQKIPIGAKFIP
jgi:hypothetical protein